MAQNEMMKEMTSELWEMPFHLLFTFVSRHVNTCVFSLIKAVPVTWQDSL